MEHGDRDDKRATRLCVSRRGRDSNTALSLQAPGEERQQHDGHDARHTLAELVEAVAGGDEEEPNQHGHQQAAQALPETKVIILTTFDYDEYVFDGMKAGARGYMLKDIPAAELLAIIRRIHAGESIVQPSVATRLIAEFSQRRAAPQQPDYKPLSERELEVLRLLAEGYNNKAIAAQLVLAEGTVKKYVSTILDKLHAANRTHATQFARKQGLIE